MSRLTEIIEKFQHIDREFMLELLLDYANKLPAVPDRLSQADDREAHRMHECMTPVYLWLEDVNGRRRMYAEVPPESATVRGFISLMIAAFDDQPLVEFEKAPEDLLAETGLLPMIGMNRRQGLQAIYRKVLGRG